MSNRQTSPQSSIGTIVNRANRHALLYIFKKQTMTRFYIHISIAALCLWAVASGVALGQKSKPAPLPFEKVRTVIRNAIKDTAFPSAVALVWQNDTIKFHEAFGRLTYDTASAKTDTLTLYDLASLTKPLSGTLAIMKLYSDGKLSLDDSVKKFIPEFANHKKDGILIRHLLLHTSGLVAFRRYYTSCKTAEDVLQKIYNDSLIKPIGDSVIYSDLNYVIVGELIKRITGMPHSDYLDSVFAKPLGLTNLMFTPPDSLAYRIAPTETDTNWKFPTRKPRVHDPTSAMLGGISGNAGLFGAATDIAKLATLMLHGGTENGITFFSTETVKKFTARDTVHRERALGWDMRTNSEKTVTGKYFSMQTYGHTGFTGTSIFIDPSRRLCVILLTNRVYPTSTNNKIRAVRRAFHDAVIESLEKPRKPS
jgi:serine-type D-Ala-D-Ala carboxypeptidase